MICDACSGTGKTIVKATYNSNWYGKQEENIEQTCYKCRGTGETNDAQRLQEPSYDKHIGNRTRDIDDEFT